MLVRAVILVAGAALLGSVTLPAQAYHDDTVECKSSGYKYTECEAPFRHPQLVEQLSDSACVVNKSWGYNRDTGSIWVKDGCAGTFSDSRAGGDDRRHDDYANSRDDRDDRDDRNDHRRRPPPRDEVVECRSSGYAFTRCDAEWGEARLVEQLSATQCVEDRTWGIDEDGLWVDKGCAGRFAGH